MASIPSATRKQIRESAQRKTIGKPRKFPTEDAFIDAFVVYVKWCNDQDPKRIPCIAEFCTFNDMTRTTYYEYEAYYPNAFAKTRQILEAEHLNIRDTIRSIFLMKSLHGYNDRPETTININMQLDDSEIRQRLSDAGYQLIDGSCAPIDNK